MANRNFGELSPSDFEDLCCDILAAQLGGAHVESFTAGRDRGIDLRVITRNRKSSGGAIGQCKHYAKSGYAKLLSKLTDEKTKVLALKPSRYLIFTTVDLTPDRKAEIVSALTPIRVKASDVWGADDISNFLRQNPNVEKAHYKLWINSTAVLERILHAGTYVRSDAYMAEVVASARVYVQNRSYREAANKLDNGGGVCVISGPPGVGKTTLANILLLDYVAQGFEPIVLSSDLSEADGVWNPGRRQVFLYDDFLGRTSALEQLGKNEDDRLLRFMVRVSKVADKRLILTTREYLLQQARGNYERLNDRRIDLAKITVDLSSYGRLDRARILYNHIFFSDLRPTSIAEILEGRKYGEIINHPNYVPRLIGDAVSLYGASAESGRFDDYLISTLDRPEELWAHVLERQLSPGSQLILLLMLAFEDDPVIAALRVMFLASTCQDRGFDDCLRAVEGTVVHVDWSGVEGTVDYINPGVQDAVTAVLGRNDRLVIEALGCLSKFDELVNYWARVRGGAQVADVPSVATSLRSVGVQAGRLPRVKQSTPALDCLKRHGDILLRSLVATLFTGLTRRDPIEQRLQLLIAIASDLGQSVPSFDWSQIADEIAGRGSRSSWGNAAALELVRVIARHQGKLPRQSVEALIVAVCDRVARSLVDPADYSDQSRLLELLDQFGFSELRERSGMMGRDDLRAEFQQYAGNGVQAIMNLDDYDTAYSDLEMLEDLMRDFDVYEDVDDARSHVEALADSAQSDEVHLEDRDDVWEGGVSGHIDPVDDLFDTLRG